LETKFSTFIPNFIRVFNDTQITAVYTKQIIAVDEVRYNLVSETAFTLAKLSFLNKVTPLEAFTEKDQRKIVEETVRSIWKSGNNSKNDFNITEIEKHEIISIAGNMLAFIEKVDGQDLIFKPKLKGYSVSYLICI